MIEELKEEIEDLKEEVSTLKREVIELENEVDELKDQNKELEDDLANAQDELDDRNRNGGYLPLGNIEKEMMYERLKENWDNLTISDIDGICKI